MPSMTKHPTYAQISKIKFYIFISVAMNLIVFNLACYLM